MKVRLLCEIEADAICYVKIEEYITLQKECG